MTFQVTLAAPKPWHWGCTYADLPVFSLACVPCIFLLWFVEREELIQGVLAQVAEQFSRYRVPCAHAVPTGLWTFMTRQAPGSGLALAGMNPSVTKPVWHTPTNASLSQRPVQ
jgi:hypothetical protein